jgi:beta-lactamase regulating signal transducer with metallopeptidase domain
MSLATSFNLLSFHGLATAASERLLYSAVGGTVLAVAVWFLLQLFPKRDSRTSFVVWFSTLLATAILPLFNLHSGAAAAGTGASQAILTIPSAWAWYVFVAWAVIAFAGLIRVAFATLQVRKLRAEAVAIDLEQLDFSLRDLVEEFQKARPVALMVSSKLEVPTAIGFRRPAIILPAWLLESTPAEELKYILLHELAHLARRDDWTNLAQKVLKAVLFFLPSVWWIERKLSLDREMACDDAVLARSGSPRGYAECLARVAQRSFLRRQIALAQAAVGRVRQLTTRVAMILDPNRPQATQMWKPAIPVVIVLAGLSALPASFTPELVHFADNKPQAHQLSASAQSSPAVAVHESTPRAVIDVEQKVSSDQKIPGIHAVQASLRTENNSAVPAVKSIPASQKNSIRTRPAPVRKVVEPPVFAANVHQSQQPQEQEYVTVREELVVMVTQQTPTGEQQSWQMHIVQVSLQPQAKPVLKPRKI